MGQSWVVINIDKMQYINWWGGLDNCLFNRGGPAYTLLSILELNPMYPLKQSPYTESLSGTWAGDRIICVGSRGEDTPHGLLAEEELQDFTEFVDECEDEYEYEDDINLWKVARKHFQGVPLVPWETQEFHMIGSRSNRVLRNLTTHEYVHEDILCDKIGHFVPGLGEVLFSCISWSTDKDTSMWLAPIEDKIQVTRGVWAGNRFDVQMADSVDGDDEWKDVTEVISEGIITLWEYEYGEEFTTTY